jgi:hypothetical protein
VAAGALRQENRSAFRQLDPIKQNAAKGVIALGSIVTVHEPLRGSRKVYVGDDDDLFFPHIPVINFRSRNIRHRVAAR